MSQQARTLSKTIFVGVCLTLGCTSGGVVGCGDSNTPTVDSNLLGVYMIDSLTATPTDEVTGDPIEGECDELVDLDIGFGDYLVLYAFAPNDNPTSSQMGGVFCNNLQDCRGEAAARPEPTIGYSFDQGNDDVGWFGFGNARQGPFTDQCLVDLQAHRLTASGDQITITSDTSEVVFMPTTDGNTATCAVADAVRAYRDDLPCKSRILLEATRQAEL